MRHKWEDRATKNTFYYQNKLTTSFSSKKQPVRHIRSMLGFSLLEKRFSLPCPYALQYNLAFACSLVPSALPLNYPDRNIVGF